MSRYRRVSLQGVICGGIRFWISSAGTPCGEWDVRDKDHIYRCIAFGDKAESAQGKVKQDVAVIIRGHYSSDEDKEAKSLIVDTFLLKTEVKTESNRDRLIREYGSWEKYLEWRARYHEKMLSDGYVHALHVDEKGRAYLEYKKKDECIQVPSEGWWSKFEFCVRVLGIDAVNEELRGFTKELRTLAPGKRDWVPRFKQKRDELVKRALLKLSTNQMMNQVREEWWSEETEDVA